MPRDLSPAALLVSLLVIVALSAAAGLAHHLGK